ncbi:MAG: UDPglucose--hexose-1-phosphate uridylyltransferase [Candidatus Omnitrophota bacterium]|jgi:UDPglucose--hexose-1-phosphate uridylyltransferase
MPELRKDPNSQRWVIVATERARRPGNLIKTDEGFSDLSQSKDLLSDQVEYIENHDDLYSTASGYGVSASVSAGDNLISLSDMSVDQIEAQLHNYVAKFEEVKEKEHLKYALLYKNDSGESSIENVSSHAQILATPVAPLTLQKKYDGARDYFAEHKSCLYEDILQQELKDNERVVAQNDDFLVYIPFAARFIFEMSIIPRAHHAYFTKGIVGRERALAEVLRRALYKIRHGLNNAAYTVALYTAPINPDCADEGLLKSFRWHMDIVPRLTHTAGFEKGTGFYINSVPPEAGAEYLRGVL